MPGHSTPLITDLRVIPVAGRDGMLLNLSGAHGPFFTRNILILTDNAGRTGVGEVPGGEKIRQTLEDARPLVVGQAIGSHQQVLQPNRHCSICWASTWRCRWPRCSAKASSARRWRCWAICFLSATS